MADDTSDPIFAMSSSGEPPSSELPPAPGGAELDTAADIPAVDAAGHSNSSARRPPRAVIGAIAAAVVLLIVLVAVFAGDDDGSDTISSGNTNVGADSVSTSSGATLDTLSSSAASTAPGDTVSGLPGDGDGDGDGSEQSAPPDGGAAPAPAIGPQAWRPGGQFLSASADGSLMAAMDGQRLVVWDSAARREVARVAQIYVDVSFAADNSLLVATTSDRLVGGPYRVDVIGLPGGDVLGSLQIPDSSVPPLYSPAAEALVLPLANGTFDVVRVDGSTVRTINAGSSERWALSADGSVLAVSTPNAVTAFDVTTGSERSTITTQCPFTANLRLSRNGEQLLVAEKCGNVSSIGLYHTGDASLLVSRPEVAAFADSQIDMSSDGTVMVVASFSLPAMAFHGDQEGTLNLAPPPQLQAEITRLGATYYAINGVALSADGSKVAVTYSITYGAGGFTSTQYTAVFEVHHDQISGDRYPSLFLSDFAATEFDSDGAFLAGYSGTSPVVYTL